MSMMMMTTVVTGRLMLKSERNMAQFFALAAGSFVAAALVGVAGGGGLYRLAFLQQRRRVADHLVALRKPSRHHEVPAARIALADGKVHLLQLVVLHAPGRGLVAIAHQRGGRDREAVGGLDLDAALRVQAGEAGLLLAGEIHQHLDLPRGRVGRGIDALHLAGEFLLAVAVDPEGHVLPRLHGADVVGRYQPFETHARRIDDLHEFLADGRGVSRGDLAVADQAVKRRAHFGALQLLACQHGTRLGRLQVALRVVAADLGVLDLLRGGHPGAAQRRHALELALGLLERLGRRAAGRLGGGERVADRRVVQAHQQVAAPDVVAVLLEDLQDHRIDLGAQVGAPLRLHRPGDGRAGGQCAVLHHMDVFGGDEQRRARGGLLVRRRALAAGGERKRQHEDETVSMRHGGIPGFSVRCERVSQPGEGSQPDGTKCGYRGVNCSGKAPIFELSRD